jgi:hypothetical protein
VGSQAAPEAGGVIGRRRTVHAKSLIIGDAGWRLTENPQFGLFGK